MSHVWCKFGRNEQKKSQQTPFYIFCFLHNGAMCENIAEKKDVEIDMNDGKNGIFGVKEENKCSN